MLKKLFIPFQILLLKRKMCAKCTRNLDDEGNRTSLDEDRAVVKCKCERNYIIDLKSGNYRTLNDNEKSEIEAL